MHTPKDVQSGKALGWIIFIIVVVVAAILFTRSDNVDTADTADTYEVTINNVSTDQPLSPGVYVVHTDEASLDFSGSLSPESLEPLAEYGSHADFAAFVQNVPGVVEVITVDDPILPGGSTSFMVTLDEEQGGLLLSGIQMAVASNDGYALVNAMPIEVTSTPVAALNYDNGTEENTELGSGFEGGQPDPAQGEANIENGTPTDPQAEVAPHDQLTETILTVSITEVDDEAMEDDSMEDDEMMENDHNGDGVIDDQDTSLGMPADPNNPVDEMIVEDGSEESSDAMMEETPEE